MKIIRKMKFLKLFFFNSDLCSHLRRKLHQISSMRGDREGTKLQRAYKNHEDNNRFHSFEINFMVEYRAFLFKILHNKCLKIYDKTSKQ